MPAQIFEETLTQRDELLHQVTPQLRSRCGDQFLDLRIIVYQNGLILQGRASTYYGKQMAQEVAKSVLGLAVVRNEIEVSKPK